MKLTQLHQGPHLPDCLEAAGIVGAWAHDTVSDLVVVDAGVAHLFGIPDPNAANGDPIGRYIEAIHPADRRGFSNEVMAASRAGTAFASQYRIRTSAGVRWVHDYGSFTIDAQGRPVQGKGIIIDVTRRHREADAIDELSMRMSPDVRLQGQLNQLAAHAIATSEIARTLPSARLRTLTYPLLSEIGRLLAWALARHG